MFRKIATRSCRFLLQAPNKKNYTSNNIYPDKYSAIGALVGAGNISIAEESEYLQRISILKDELAQSHLSAQERITANEEMYNLYSKIYQTNQATKYLEDAYELKKHMYGPISEQVLQHARQIRNALEEQHRLQEATNYQLHIIELLAKLSNQKSSSEQDEQAIKQTKKFAPEWYHLGDLYYKLMSDEHAKDALEKCSAILEKNSDANNLLIKAQVRLGFVHYRKREYKEALEVLEKQTSKAQVEQVFADAIEYSDLYLNMGNCCMYLNDAQKSEKYFTRAIQILKTKASPETQDKLGELLYSLAVVYSAKPSQASLAHTMIQDALSIFLKQEEKRKGDLQLAQYISQCYMTIANMEQQLGKLDPAQANYKLALQWIQPLTDRYRMMSDSEWPLVYCKDVGFIYFKLAEIEEKKNKADSEECTDMYRTAIDVLQRCKEPKQVRHLLAECYKQYGAFLLKHKNMDKARDQLEKSYNLFSELTVLDFDPDLGNVSMMLAETSKQDYKKAIAYYDEAVSVLMIHDNPSAATDAKIRDSLRLLREAAHAFGKDLQEREARIKLLEEGKAMVGDTKLAVRPEKLLALKATLNGDKRLVQQTLDDATAKEKMIELKRKAFVKQ